AIQEEGLLENALRLETYFLERLAKMQASHPIIGHTRCKGCLMGVELVKDRTTKEPFNTPEDKLAGRPLVVDEVARAMLADGVYVFGWVSHLLVAPPLIITRAELDRGLEVLDRALAVADAKVAARTSGS
ncbi:MAG: aminotransferase class III-fold pyridoxal phosphate-dependent enzyme, partial [Thermoplasmata archaeon]|nr:aminotransferase class III-fold pyridoxal phosphate-dependent enzyme [Thermoplasmata archaeon]